MNLRFNFRAIGRLGTGAVTALACAGAFWIGVVSRSAAAQAPGGLEIHTISTRPDTVTGGDVLVQIKLPTGTTLAGVTITLNAEDITAAFKPTSDSRALLGLVRGLRVGTNQFVAGVKSSRASSQLTLVNYPQEGPVFSGPHQFPFVCETQALGLGASLDTDCGVKTKVEYFYRSNAANATPSATNPAASVDAPAQVAANAFKPLDPTAPRPADVATTTTSDGRTVPYIVRREMGTINRAVYVIALLHEPGTPLPDPWTPAPGWNGKLVYSYGGGCRAGYHQGRAIGGLSPAASYLEEQQVGYGDYLISKGYALAGASLNVTGTNCDDVISAETTMMVKEHFIEEFGAPRYTIGAGGSGGSIQQHMIVNNYPGLLDGIIPGRSFSDVIDALEPTFDCELLNRAFTTTPVPWTNAQKTAVTGHKDYNYCAMRATSYPILRATNCDTMVLGKDLIFDSIANPKGARCTYQDNEVNQFGRDPQTGFARRPFDNTGIQYGLNAFNAGQITFEQFIDLNERIGGHDIDGNLVARRTVADPDALRIAYRTGRVNEGQAGLAMVPIIDLRSYLDGTADVHDAHHSLIMRARLQAANGRADNQVIITVASLGALQKDLAATGGPLRTVTRAMLDEMDRWLDNISRDSAPARSQLERVVRDKPRELVDACYDDKIEKITDPARCAQLFPYYGNPRVAAGEPLVSDRLKCALKPVTRKDYAQAVTDRQFAALTQAFPQGVCDYTKVGVGQRPGEPWLFYPGGAASANLARVQD